MNCTTTGPRTSAVMLACAVIASVMAFAAESTEKVTVLPLHQGLSFQQEVKSQVCGKNAAINLYDTSMDASMDEYVAWYKQQLKNFHYVHKVDNRAQELFYSPDGSKAVGITGVPDDKGVFAVAYMKLSSNLTVHQEDAFSPANPTCK